MLRKLALVIPALILAALAGLGYTYIQKTVEQERHQPARPAPLPAEIISQGGKWEWVNNEDQPRTFIRATSFKEYRNPAAVDLQGLELLVYDKDQQHYDLITSDGARFSKDDQTLYAEGIVKITLGLPREGPRPDRLLEIETSGVRFEMQTNKAMSEKEVRFRFGPGSGQATGAEYDPTAKEIRLKQSVNLTWADEKSPERTMHIQAAEAVYKETESKVLLAQPSKLTRGTLTLEGGNAVVTLDKGVIRKVETEKAKGADQQPKRNLEFAANSLLMDFTDKGATEKIVGNGDARLVTTAETARTTMTAGLVDLAFAVAGNDSTLERAFAQGNARVESRPLPHLKAPPETKVLTSEVIELKMRPGGEEVDRMETHTPAHLELLPNRAPQRKRSLDGERIYITYGAKNQIDNLRAVKVATRTEPDATRKGALPALTWSQDFLAQFNPISGDIDKLEQWTSFRYQEGTRHATADRALLEQAANRITLTGKPRMWDPSGSTDADRILLDQKTGDFTALGNVRTVRQGERQAASLVNADPVRATADQMYATDGNRRVRYNGQAVLWQGANRLTAQRIEINRIDQTLDAYGQVTSQLLDKQPEGLKTKTAPLFTVVKAPEMHYSDKEKMAHYLGGTQLTRPALQVKSQELRAYFAEENTETQNEVPGSGLEKTFANGRVEIIDRRGEQTRQGWGEQAEYLVTDNKLTIEGGQPRMVDLLRGIQQRSATGRQLTWIAQEERLLVDGEESKPAQSTVKRKKK